MKFIKALLLGVSAVSVLIAVSLLSLYTYIPYLSYNIKQLFDDYQVTRDVFSLFLFIVCVGLLLLFVLLLFIPSYRKKLVIHREKGIIEIPKKTIESVIRNTYGKSVDPEGTRLKVKIHRDETVLVKLTIYVNNKERFQEVAETIQEDIEQALDHSIQAKTRHVTIKVKEKSVDLEKKKSPFRSKSSRVV